MKTAMLVMFVLAAGASALQAQSVDPTPYAWEFPQVTGIASGADVMKTELQEQIQAVLDAGHLAPIYISRSDQQSVGYAVYLEPGRILTTIAWAYPHLTTAQQAAARSYAAAELADARFAPWGAYPLPKDVGTPRETHPKTKWWYESATFGQYRPSVQTIYGLWLYGYRTGDWTPVQNNWASIKTMYSARAAQGNLYGTMCAHIAMARLADRFSDAATRTTAINNLQAQLNAGLTFSAIEQNASSLPQTWNAPYHDMYDSRMDSSTYRGWMFLNLSPEMGRYLRDHVQSATISRHDSGKVAFPLWWIGKASYFNRSWTGDEGTGLVPEVLGMMAPVERWVVQAGAATLKGQMASNPTGIGDCYWIEALVQAIEAYGTIAWADVRTGVTPTLYTLTVTSGTGGGSYAAGTVVSIAANPSGAGMLFDRWTGATVANATASSTTLTMPAANTSVTATYKAAPLVTYTLTVNSGSGNGTYTAGTVVAIAADPPGAGMAFDRWTGATVANATSASTSITMPAANAAVTATYVASGAPLSAPWTDADVGSPSIAGDASATGSTFMVCGSGADIWGAADSFHFASMPLNGDGTIVARILSMDNTDPWAKAGVMIRESAAANAANAFTALTPGNGTAFQRRTAAAGASVSTAGPNVPAPYWVRLARAGAVFTASVSPDGTNWTVIDQDTIPMAASVLIGIAVTSHTNAALSCATVDSITGTGGWAGAAAGSGPPAGGTGNGGGGGGGACGLTGLELLPVLLLFRTWRRRRLS
jgi:regulation of enolase protein 1 (concanavalin A-like superfamily)